MGVRRCLVALALAAAFLVPLSPVAPAHAGQDYWSAEACRPDVYWYNQTGVYGTYYWWSNGAHYHFVGGGIMNVYSRWGWQCGRLGPPTTDYDGWAQYFQNGVIWYDSVNGCLRVSISGGGGSPGCA